VIHIVAHGVDVDGLASHSILEIYAKKRGIKTIHCFVDYQDVGSVLENISRIIKSDDEVIIADIGYEKELVYSFLNRYREMAKITSWFDHHKWEDRAKEEAKKILKEVIIDESRCAAEILKERFLPDDRFVQELASIARVHDFYDFESGIYEHARKLQDVIVSGYSKEAIVKQLSSGIFWIENFETVHKKYREVIRPNAIAEMDSTIMKYSVVTSDNIVASVTAVFVPNILESKDIRAYLMLNEDKKDERDVIIAIWSNGRIAYEGRSEKFRKILEKINENFKGGGRGLAGGATYSESVSMENYKICFDEIIKAIKR